MMSHGNRVDGGTPVQAPGYNDWGHEVEQQALGARTRFSAKQPARDGGWNKSHA
jgi:hypothetical protein